MNSRTSKQLSRAAVVIAMISVSQSPQAKRLSPQQRHKEIADLSRKTYANLKQRWKGLPHTQRHTLRVRLATLTSRTKAVL